MQPRITFVHPDGTRDDVDVAPGRSVMEAAKINQVDGIVAECGGNAMCATCHVYVADEWTERLPEISMVEESMLEFTACERTDASRLSCQIEVTEELDGLVVELPEEQL
ncbi:2Fe-2S iron-sulfur cluster-binding protein [Nocardiopsis sp. ATB16-24]|uniref:2Fe-2S iron-sulfur cluster-binding protein n=1 Tax=Nocardiopsis sp. ATB16-24 TaxID=3019555 RepID=UPI002556B81B|nr:2Fe-2S iron-sulfur cluster-binding protein [Nocardiopsis sp. ATB16-24]